MQRVKRFFKVAKAVLDLISKLLPLVGDIMDVIKVVDSLVDSFVERRDNGELKDVSFIEFVSAIIRLCGELAPYGYTFIDVIETIIDYAHKFGKELKPEQLATFTLPPR